MFASTNRPASRRSRFGIVSAAAIAMLAVQACRSPYGAAGQTRVNLYAAASTAAALEEVVAAFRSGHGEIEVATNAAGSSILARQIENGAPADVFLSANESWLEHLDARGLIEPATRTAILSNRIVLVAPRGAGLEVEFRDSFDFAAAIGTCLALGEPHAVPVGIYARQALESLGWWDAVAGRTVTLADTRAVLAVVARGQCDGGFVYASDAAGAAAVEIVGVVPAHLHDPIVYGLAVVAGRGRTPVSSLRDYLLGEEAQAIFRRHGFLSPPHAGADARSAPG